MAEPEDPHDAEGDTSGGEDLQMMVAIFSVAGCGALFGVLAFLFADLRTGLGVLVGGVLATVNLVVFARIGQAFLGRDKANMARWGLVAVLKLVLLFGGVGLILKSGVLSGVSLAIGYAALPFGITIASLFGPKPSEDAAPPTESARRGRDVIKPPRDGSDGPEA